MHLQIKLRPPQGGITLPIHYNHMVQAALYNSIDPGLSSFLHNKGFADEKRVFKIFAFSLLQGTFVMEKERGSITFKNDIKLTVSSPVEEFCQSLVNTLLTKGHIRLGQAEPEVEGIDAQRYIVGKGRIAVKTLSPVVLYSTLLRPDGRKYTCYFQPGEPDYDKLLNGNIQNKYRAFYGTEPPAEKVSAKPLGRQRLSIINYKGIIVKGYAGRLLLTGPVPLLQLAVDGGLGGKNTQGFGCVELLGGEKREEHQQSGVLSSSYR